MSTATEVRERPILFSGAMVQAILDGRKTQTRRVVKPQPHDEVIEVFNWSAPEIPDEAKAAEGCYYTDVQGLHFHAACPYGQPGDLLWVRETWGTRRMVSLTHRRPPFDSPVYRAGRQVLASENAPPDYDVEKWPVTWSDDPSPDGGRWRPSIHMPKTLARIWLRVTDVRVERVQEITEDDVLAEGITHGEYLTAERRIGAFRRLWNTLNAVRGYGWDANPWVWVVMFERTEAP